jgi:glycosyltransferase involved in cell wall biosynthesis
MLGAAPDVAAVSHRGGARGSRPRLASQLHEAAQGCASGARRRSDRKNWNDAMQKSSEARRPPLRIAQVAPLFESVPPKYYGGTERVVSFLTEELVRQGHSVTLFASGDSDTRARLVSGSRRALRLDKNCVDHLALQVLQTEKVYKRKTEFDVLHFHIDYLHYPISRCHDANHFTTLHGRLDIPELVPLYQEFRDIPVVSISDAQREPLPQAQWLATVHHGLPDDLFRFQPEPGSYFAFLGRVSPEKRVDRAIRIAEQLDTPIKIAAKVDRIDRDYFEDVVEPLLRSPRVEFVGEIGEGEKQEFLGNALALLFPIDWPEPFGLVMIEALACGTPVVAYEGGSVAEIIEQGRTGFIVSGFHEAVAAARRVSSLSRKDCRGSFEQRFTARRMASDYVALYERLLERRRA